MPRAKSKIVKQILIKLLIGGAIFIAAQSPYFWSRFYKNLFAGKFFLKDKKKFQNIFYYLKRKGLIKTENKNGQIYIYLTEKGEWEAGRYQINDLYIKSQKKWDKKWRVIIFDIPEADRIKREAFRGKLKELGFRPLQKSVWLYPYPCQKEIKLLRDFFGLDRGNIMTLEVSKMENDNFFKKLFKL